MTKILITMALLSAGVLDAQVVAPTQDLQLPGINEVRLETLEGWRVRVENREKTAIVAMHATFRCPAHDGYGRSEVGFYFDHLYNYGSDKQIAPGQFLAFAVSAQTALCPGGIDAAIFADGHSVGDTAEVADIYGRRLGASEAIVISEQELQRIIGRTSRASDIATDLRARSKAVSQDEGKSAAEREGSMYALSLVAALLDSQSEWQVPSDGTSLQQASVEEVTRETGMPQEQAHASVLTKKLAEWSAGLEGKLQPPAGK